MAEMKEVPEDYLEDLYNAGRLDDVMIGAIDKTLEILGYSIDDVIKVRHTYKYSTLSQYSYQELVEEARPKTTCEYVDPDSQ